MAEIQWGLLGNGVDALQALQVYGAAQQDALKRKQYAKEQETDAAIRTAAAKGDLSVVQGLLMQGGRWSDAAAAGRIGADRREVAGNAALSGALSGGAVPALVPGAAPSGGQVAGIAAAPGAAPVDAQNGDIVVTAPRPQPTVEQQAADLSQYGPEVVKQFLDIKSKLSSLGDDKVKQVKAQHEAFGPLVPELKKLPLEQRRAALDTRRDYLKSVGFTDKQIDEQDLSDAGLDTEANLAIGLDAALKMQQDEQQFKARMAQDEAQSARSASLTIRGQNMTDRRQRDLNEITRNLPKPATEFQSKAQGYLRSGAAALRVINGLKDYSVGEVGRALDAGATGSPFRRQLSQNDRRALNAQKAFANAVLRLESGAVVSDKEISLKAQTLFPLPGDGPQVLADKRAQREAGLAAMRDASGPGGKNVPRIESESDPAGWKVDSIKRGR